MDRRTPVIAALLPALFCLASAAEPVRAPAAAAADSPADLVEALRVAMRAQDVPLAARNELLEAISPLRRDVASR